MQGIALGAFFLMLCAAFGFHQAFHWDLVTLIVVMVLMVPVADFVSDRLMYPKTRELFARDPRYTWGFLAVVSVMALIHFYNKGSLLQRADNEVTLYAACWWFTFPMCCIMLVMFDRLGNFFGGRPVAGYKGTDEHFLGRAATEERMRKRAADEAAQADNVIQFDPDRFR
jgi:hypothetical protein